MIDIGGIMGGKGGGIMDMLNPMKMIEKVMGMVKGLMGGAGGMGGLNPMSLIQGLLGGMK